MSCKELFTQISAQQSNTKLDCPVKIFPKCHPKSPVDVFVDAKRKSITLTCGRCDRILSRIRIR